MNRPQDRIRIDFTFEEITPIGEDKDAKYYRIKMVPDRRSWERIEINGEKGYLNKFDNTFISDRVFAKSVRNTKSIPITVSSETIGNEQEYIEKSKKRVKEGKE